VSSLVIISRMDESELPETHQLAHHAASGDAVDERAHDGAFAHLEGLGGCELEGLGGCELEGLGGWVRASTRL
jgi:hypothetical protein